MRDVVTSYAGPGGVDAIDKIVESGDLVRLPWWHPGSAFAAEARAHGVAVPPRAFVWSTQLGGLTTGLWDWYAAGHALAYFVKAECGGGPVNLVAHSHGGQVAAFGAATGEFEVRVLVTLGTPVRRDMLRFRRRARPHVERWRHVWSPNDGVQLAGEAFDGALGDVRVMPEADLNECVLTEEPDAHGKLHDERLWTRRRMWAPLAAV